MNPKKPYIQSIWSKQSLSIIIPILVLCVGLFFSYRPTISFGTLAGANLEISITQLAIAFFVLCSVSHIYRARQKIIRNKVLLILGSLAIFSTISLAWTDNTARGLLAAALLWAIVLLFVAVISRYNQIFRYRRAVTIALCATIIAVCLFAWIQIFLDALGVPTSVSLLPIPYISTLFGFARPTAFALEPQFLGSLLFAPILYTAYLEITARATTLSRIVLLLSVSVLVATISRGAYLAVSVGLVILFIAYVRKNTALGLLRVIGVMVSALALSLSLIAIAADINTRDSTGAQLAISRSINQLTLGLIEIPAEETPKDQPSLTIPVVSPEPIVDPVEQTPQLAPKPYTGYVPESTDSRLLMVREAIGIWSSSWATILFGIGIGSFGMTLHEKNPNYSISSIVNNQYLEILVETGIVGLILFLLILLCVVTLSIRRQSWVGLAIISAFCIQWLFFSGNVNVLHVWVFLILYFLYLINQKPRLQAKSKV